MLEVGDKVILKDFDIEIVEDKPRPFRGRLLMLTELRRVGGSLAHVRGLCQPNYSLIEEFSTLSYRHDIEGD